MMDTISSGLTGASGRRKTEFQTLNMAVFAPMPRASVSTATAVNPGFFSSWRKANLRSFITQCLHWIDTRRTSRGDVAREKRNSTQESGNARKSDGIKSAKPEEQSGEEPGRRCRSGESYHHPQRHRPHALTQNQSQDVSSPSSQSHADTDLVRAPYDGEAHHAINPNGIEKQPQQPD